jgi:hypothetical protein
MAELRRIRAMCDTMIFDKIVADADVLARLNDQGCPVTVISTHVQDDELAAIGDESKRAAVARVPRENVPTADFVAGFSRLGMARLGEGEVYEQVRGEVKSPKHSRDGIIAGTAKTDADVLVTDDHRLARRCEEIGFPVWGWVELRGAILRPRKP